MFCMNFKRVQNCGHFFFFFFEFFEVEDPAVMFWIPTFDHLLPVTSITANPVANYMFKVNNGNNTEFGLPFGSAAVIFFPFCSLILGE